MNVRNLPWYDYSARFSPLKAAVFASLFVPVLWTAVSYWMDRLGARPLTESIHQIGDWTIRLIFIALVISPARVVLQWPKLLELRRMIGVAACLYALTHLSLYIVDEAFSLPLVVSEIVLRIYLTIGFTALTGLIVLAWTSTDGWQRRLGARRWQKLHRIVYLIGTLAVIHFFLQSKLDEWEPTVMAGIFVWLMSCRLASWRFGRGKLPLWTVASLSLGAGVLTALCEAGYYWWSLGAPLDLVLQANLTFDTGVRPAVVVFASTFAIALVGVIRATVWRPSKARKPKPA
ncbi:MAG TPA: protein-methionine-sulfoxide reductase heme-binding subunit MsrQ [Stellaceae bacterium]|jgi:sulfoxide reductase heme-binding subunit YedZ|nr:protein-methionine-sulfoxide reductase heme-binding subunit MsrQ [Stellaceae bacterium]